MVTRFGMDIQKILDEYCKYLYSAFGTWSINIFEIDEECRAAFIDEVLTIYLREYLFPCTDIVDLRLEVRELIQDAALELLEELSLLDKYEEAIQHYSDNFRLPDIDITQKRDMLLKEVLELDSSNAYYIKLHRALLYCFWENLDELKTYQLINDILVDYDFSVKIPEEEQCFREERFRINNYIPDFSNVKVGDTWKGRSREANFIRALKLTPMPAGKNTRKSQVKSIARSCSWVDDEENQVLTLIEIRTARLDKVISRPRKYEDLLTTVLLYRLQLRDEPFITSQSQFFKSIGVLPKAYSDYSTHLYSAEEPLKGNVSYRELAVCQKLFRDISYDRLGQILKANLDYLCSKNIIKVSEHEIIVVETEDGIKHVSLNDCEEVLRLKPNQVERMLADATTAALNQISVYDEKTKGHKQLETIDEMRRYHKWDEYKDNHDKYVKDAYGWLYTYFEMAISLHAECVFAPITFAEYETARYELNKIIVDAISSTIQNRNSRQLENYNLQTEQLTEVLESDHELRELYDAGLIDDSNLIGKRQYVYPEKFMFCLETFMGKEICLPPQSKCL